MVILSPFTSPLSPLLAQTPDKTYLCELGLLGGCGYYVGDAAPHIFMHPREAYGVLFRYKFDDRWAIQAKLSGQRIQEPNVFENRLYNADVMGEFNFLRFGSKNEYDSRVKPYTPYIFIGVGTGVNMHDSVYTQGGTPRWSSIYIPVGIGFKWKFAERFGLNIAWQHNIYCADGIEGKKEQDNTHGLNGWNIMNMDLTGMLTVGLTVEFAPQKAPCRNCD